MNYASRPVRNPEVDSVEIDGDIVLYDGQHLRLLAGTAAVIWRAVDGAASVRDLLGSLASSDEGVERDVLAFLDDLVEQQLILAPPPDGRPRYVAAGGCAHVVDGEQVLLLNLRTGKRQALFESGRMIWESIRVDPDPRTAVAGLRRHYSDVPASVVDEVDRLLNELVVAGFLVCHR